MMKPAEDRLSGEPAQPLDRPMARRILVGRQMLAEIVIVKGIGSKNPAQKCLAEDDDVIEAFADADCPCRKLHPAVFVMKSAEDGSRRKSNRPRGAAPSRDRCREGRIGPLAALHLPAFFLLVAVPPRVPAEYYIRQY
jgi:hypothetical protein